MGDLSELAGNPTDVASPLGKTERGYVKKPPASNSDAMVVAVQDFSGEHVFTVPAGQWEPRGTELPVADAKCLIVFDSRDDAWVPMWRGVTAIPAVTFESGEGVPDDSVGQDGAIYLDRDTYLVYGPKAAGVWPSDPFAKLLPLTPDWSDVSG